MSILKFSRRRFLFGAAALATPLALVADAKWIEPTWLKIRRLRLAPSHAAHRFVHFTDLHHKGDRAYTRAVVSAINSLAPDFVCFTGDLIEETDYLTEALELLAGIKAPLFGVPGNHDYWSRCSFEPIARCFAATGGAWLVDEQRVIAGGKINLLGVARMGPRHPLPSPAPGMKNIVLVHYPAWVKSFTTQQFDLLLAGHSHGGQVRIPFYGAIMLPFAVDEYDLGLFHTPHGPLYVNPGIGWFPVPIRFNCRPEITLIEI